MKTKYYQKLNTLTVTLGCIAINACQSHEQKANDAFENVKEGKISASNNIVETNPIEPVANQSIKKTISLNEWEQYKIEIEARLIDNEINIRKLKSQDGVEAKHFKKINAIEKENTLMRLKMNEFNSETNNRLEKFKSEMNAQIKAIAADIKEAKPETLTR
jgi:hypothetical protein